MQGLDGEVFVEHPTRHLTKHLTISVLIGGDASLRRNST